MSILEYAERRLSMTTLEVLTRVAATLEGMGNKVYLTSQPLPYLKKADRGVIALVDGYIQKVTEASYIAATLRVCDPNGECVGYLHFRSTKYNPGKKIQPQFSSIVVTTKEYVEIYKSKHFNGGHPDSVQTNVEEIEEILYCIKLLLKGGK